MIGRHLGKQLVAAVAAAGMLQGCAFGPQLRQVAVNQNQMVAEAEDELTLLNIVRASQRFPLHFTTIGEINGNAQFSTGLGLDLTLAQGPNSHDPGSSLGVQTSPSYKASVLGTEKFQRGIQQPIAAETVAAYLEAGWPDELILALLVERVDVYSDQKRLTRADHIDNEPGNNTRFAKFLCNFELTTKATASSRPLAGFADLIDLDGKDDADARRKEITGFLALLEKDSVALSEDTLYLTGSSSSVVINRLDEARCGEAVDPSLNGATLVPRFRSTQGMIYFLGEYFREAKSRHAYNLPFLNDECPVPVRQFRPILTVEDGSGRALVATKFRGVRYFIPEPAGNQCTEDEVIAARSMQVVAIVQQLLNLHKSAEDLPRSISVTGID
ncbi:hypothetical protein [Pontixanthobacter aquaemixtae]|uniref:Lipoprotein n=1 Tax=Pontixanthobacter aquaemixtae TaxID=1958940 RepID=A0A845A2W4_9SPHN|nr:hypothetical protein [Pontixanthobacter aquaemixtae]MXO91959.1 hypothetical protein [Pontixanthobacter aquaemixtae]